MSPYKAIAINNNVDPIYTDTSSQLIENLMQSHRTAVSSVRNAEKYTVFQVKQIEDGKVVDEFNLEVSISRIVRGYPDIRKYGYDKERR